MKALVHVLIVEDDLLTAIAIEEALVGAGFVVSGLARTYEEALRVAERLPVQVAIVDVYLNSTPDGIATARALLRQQWMALLFLTGQPDEATFNRAKATNPAAFLSKPFRPQELVQQVRLAAHNTEQTTPPGPAVTTTEPLYLPVNHGYVRVLPAEILYLQADGNYTDLYLTDDALHRVVPASRQAQSVKLMGNLGHWLAHLPPRFFHRLSKSVSVNLLHVNRVDTHHLVVGTHTIALPVGSRKALLDQLHIVPTR
jgi:DNA-binding LytR/AlgR family response regulator